MSNISTLSGTTRGRATSCCFLGRRRGSARGRCGAASDWVGFCAIIIGRRRDGASAASVFWPYGFDRALSMLILHFVADPQRAAAEMRRVVRPGGVAAAAVWDNYGGMPAHRLFWDTFSAIEPTARPKLVARPTTQPGELKKTFANAGFIDITETMLTIRMEFGGIRRLLAPAGVRSRNDRRAAGQVAATYAGTRSVCRPCGLSRQQAGRASQFRQRGLGSAGCCS